MFRDLQSYNSKKFREITSNDFISSIQKVIHNGTEKIKKSEQKTREIKNNNFFFMKLAVFLSS